ncbi:MAG TPA: beta-eliminating lyase-related protein, partial [Paucimonas sp.]|nr:beta-eliminating lyase-related protein [Paucimonas sp.]
KMLGGGMRQAGLLAAAGIHALEHHVHRLADDHALAAELARQLREVAAGHRRLAGQATVHEAQTNMVFMDVDAELADAFVAHLKANDVRVTAGTQRSGDRMVKRIRWVTHLDVGREDVRHAMEIIAKF